MGYQSIEKIDPNTVHPNDGEGESEGDSNRDHDTEDSMSFFNGGASNSCVNNYIHYSREAPFLFYPETNFFDSTTRGVIL